MPSKNTSNLSTENFGPILELAKNKEKVILTTFKVPKTRPKKIFISKKLFFPTSIFPASPSRNHLRTIQELQNQVRNPAPIFDDALDFTSSFPLENFDKIDLRKIPRNAIPFNVTSFTSFESTALLSGSDSILLLTSRYSHIISDLNENIDTFALFPPYLIISTVSGRVLIFELRENGAHFCADFHEIGKIKKFEKFGNDFFVAFTNFSAIFFDLKNFSIFFREKFKNPSEIFSLRKNFIFRSNFVENLIIFSKEKIENNLKMVKNLEIDLSKISPHKISAAQMICVEEMAKNVIIAVNVTINKKILGYIFIVDEDDHVKYLNWDAEMGGKIITEISEYAVSGEDDHRCISFICRNENLVFKFNSECELVKCETVDNIACLGSGDESSVVIKSDDYYIVKAF